MKLITGILCLTSALWCNCAMAQYDPEAPIVQEANKPYYYRQVNRRKPKMIECEVAVYGGTPAGVTAAVQAAREGKQTMLLSFNRYVGGMTSGGLTATDVGKKESIGGLALEFYNRLGILHDFRPSEAERAAEIELNETGDCPTTAGRFVRAPPVMATTTAGPSPSDHAEVSKTTSAEE